MDHTQRTTRFRLEGMKGNLARNAVINNKDAFFGWQNVVYINSIAYIFLRVLGLLSLLAVSLQLSLVVVSSATPTPPARIVCDVLKMTKALGNDSSPPWCSSSSWFSSDAIAESSARIEIVVGEAYVLHNPGIVATSSLLLLNSALVCSLLYLHFSAYSHVLPRDSNIHRDAGHSVCIPAGAGRLIMMSFVFPVIVSGLVFTKYSKTIATDTSC